MKPLILFLCTLLLSAGLSAQSDDAFVTFGFLRDRGILKEDTLLYVKPEMLTREIAKIPVGTADTNALITPTKLDSILNKLPKGVDSSIFVTSHILDSVVQTTIARIPKGDQGIQGIQGNAGYTPIKGVDYNDGAKGDKGDQGNIGLTGNTGNTGTAGTNGTNGTNGAGFTNSSAATSATTGTMTVNMTTDIITITPTGACTFNAASGGTTGNIVTFIVTTSGTSSFTLTFGTNFRKVGTLATGTTSARFFAVTFRCINGTIWQEICRTAAQT
jgi:hypothetical protein